MRGTLLAMSQGKLGEKSSSVPAGWLANSRKTEGAHWIHFNITSQLETPAAGTFWNWPQVHAKLGNKLIYISKLDHYYLTFYSCQIYTQLHSRKNGPPANYSWVLLTCFSTVMLWSGLI